MTGIRPQALVAVFIVAFLGFFDMTVIYVATPEIQHRLGADYASVQWVITGYVLPFALLVVTGGRLGDLWGIRRAYLVGTACFTAASLAAGLATGIGVLIAARVAQGVAGAVMAPQVLATLRVMVPAARRGPAIAGYAAVVSLATFCGPVLGGLLLQTGLGWRSIFLINVPLGAAAVALGRTHVTDLRTGDGPPRLDLPGVLMAGCGMFLLLYPMMYAPPWSWAVLLAAVAVLTGFVAYERRAVRRGRVPLIALHLFTRRAFTAGLLINVLVAVVLADFFLTFVVVLRDGYGLSDARVGLTAAPWAFGTAVASLLAVKLARRFGRRTLAAGAVLMLAGMAALIPGVAALATAPLVVAAAILACGVGMGLVGTPVLETTMNAVPAADAGSAAGTFTTFKQIGVAMGIAASGMLFFGPLGDPDHAPRETFVHAFQNTLAVNIVLCLLAAVMIAALPRLRAPAPVPASGSAPVPASGSASGSRPRPVVLLFPGQGAQHARMGAGLYGADPVFTATMDEAFALIGATGGRLREEWLAEEPSALYDDVTRAQPLLYAVDCALGRAVLSRGVRPAALLGHSVGEMAAATLAGVFTFEDGMRLMRDRVDRMAGAAPGGMLTVAATADDVTPYLCGQVAVGAVNGPRQILLAGPAGDLAVVRERLEADGFTCLPARARQAFHSPAVRDAAAASVPAWRASDLSAPHIPVYSAYLGGPLTTDRARDPEFWAGQAAAPVYFGPTLDRLLADADRLLVEAGPGQSLAMLARRHPAVAAGRSAVTALLPARPGPPELDRATLRAAVRRIRDEGHALSGDLIPQPEEEGETCPTQRSRTR